MGQELGTLQRNVVLLHKEQCNDVIDHISILYTN